MTAPSPSQLLDAVRDIIHDVAAAEIMPRWRNLAEGDISEKTGPDDLVTVADQAAERALSPRLTGLIAGSRVVGEEAVSADPSVRTLFRGTGPLWVIDPIDGTSAFAAGEPDFTVMVALVEDKRLRAGWIIAPALGRDLWGGAETGVFRSTGAAPHQLPAPRVPAAVGSMTGILGKRNITAERHAELQRREKHFKALEGVTYAGIDYQRLAMGEVQFAAYSKSEPWDHLPGLAILSAYGFACCRFDGSPYRAGDNEGGLLVAPGEPVLAEIRGALFD
ncbi:MAG: inositol monophosphatase family protein [Hyphomicrobiaceae bacterium]